MSETKIVSRENIVKFAISLGITNPRRMKTPELIFSVKECLHCNCLILTILIKNAKRDNSPKEKAIWLMNSFLKENPRGLIREHKKFLNNLIFNLWVKKVPAATTNK